MQAHAKEIFISYDNSDRERVRKLVAFLEGSGLSVWWDKRIPPGKTFHEVIEQAIGSAKCVIVVWSKESVKSRWVREEAEIGKEREILVPVLIDQIGLPIGFRSIQAARLLNWPEVQDEEQLNELLDSVKAILGHKEVPETDNQPALIIQPEEPSAKIPPEPVAQPKQLHPHQEAKQAIERQDWEEARLMLTQALGLNPDDPRLHSDLGYVLSREQNWKEAEATYRKAVELVPDKARYRGALGLALYNQGKWEEAESEYRQAVKLEPDKVVWYGCLADALAKQQKWQETVENLRTVLRIDPSDSEAQNKLEDAQRRLVLEKRRELIIQTSPLTPSYHKDLPIPTPPLPAPVAVSEPSERFSPAHPVRPYMTISSSRPTRGLVVAGAGLVLALAAGAVLWVLNSQRATENLSQSSDQMASTNANDALNRNTTPNNNLNNITSTISPLDNSNRLENDAEPSQPPTNPEPPKMIRKSGGVLAGEAIKRVEPTYPPVAKATRVSGEVVVEVIIDENGGVVSARAVSGDSLFREAAANAARGWRFKPTLLSGQPVKVVGTITFNFNP